MERSSAKAKSIFLDLIDMDFQDDAVALLERMCGTDFELREQVERLLMAHRNAGKFLDAPPSVAETSDRLNADSLPGEQLGRYVLRERIGSGGMGVVWAAEQKTPIHRKVALKLIKPGMDSEQVIARFEAEKEALALMDHPNIARVLDAGTAASGRPFFVMELVRGIPITEYCDRNRMSVYERVKLFVQVCYAIQHAHQKGIIHRDIKPSNVLVTLHDGTPVPKVIDFGVSKALHQKLTEKTIYTQFSAAIGTPLYMSPEQAELSGLDIDTRSDIYTLGVLLYELVAGEPPMSREFVSNAPFDEVQRVIREVEPQKPSTKISSLGDSAETVAKCRDTDSHRLARTLRGDLDWILLKTLEKNRIRRYATAQGLANDLVRFLNHEPVDACPPSKVYRLRKLAWRHRRQFAISISAVVVAILVVVGGLLIYSQSESVRLARVRERVREVDLPKVQRLTDEENYVGAFLLARESSHILKDDEVLARAIDAVTIRTSIVTTPPGAKIEVAQWNDPSMTWNELANSTPVVDELLPKGPVKLRVSKPGHHDRVVLCVLEPLVAIHIVLDRVGEHSDDQVSVQVGDREFLIDKHEVSNREFKEFVDAGGYSRIDYWPDLVDDLRSESEAKARIDQMVDRSGSLGPATWKDGTFPTGEENYPVRGVSWYEAAAFARFKGRSLPTSSDWNSAAPLDLASYLIPLSNYTSSGPLARGTTLGTSGFGIHDAAGNISEWSLSRAVDGRRYLCGGSWKDPSYFFNALVSYPPFERRDNFGFRCAEYDELPLDDLVIQNPRSYEVNVAIESEEQWQWCLREYSYDNTLPFRPRVVEVSNDEPHFVHQVIEIDSAYGGESLRLHLYLPTNKAPPYQTIVYFPGSSSRRFVDFEDSKYLADPKNVSEMTKSGRLVCWPEYQGTFSRQKRNSDRRQSFFQRAIDVRRSIDYLCTRSEVDSTKIAYVGFSWGGSFGPVCTAVEPRIKASVFVAGGLHSSSNPPETTAFAYAPFVRVPVLMLNGIRDHNHPVELSQKPLFNLLGTPDDQKELIIEDYDHDIPPARIGEHVDDWLTRVFGPA